MSSVGKEEVEYESDPEEPNLSLTMMRRREASDDEDEDAVDRREMHLRRIDSRVSDCESESEGAAAEYDDEEIEEENEYVSDVKALELDRDGGRSVSELPGANRVEEGEKENDGGVNLQEDVQFDDNAIDERVEGEVEGGKKENEPSAVPTAGAFYMHDDRFRDSQAGGNHRRTSGGRRLWESKDDRRWGHDKFEELSVRERNYTEGRTGYTGRNRGRGRSRGEERAYPRVNRTKAFNNNNQNNLPNNHNNAMNNQNNALDNQNSAVNNQNNTPKGVRGRGPRRYQPTWKRNEDPTEFKQRGKSAEGSSHVKSGRTSEHTSNADDDSVPDRKHVFSSLNSASPPFYPSASSNIEISFGQKIDEQFAPIRRGPQSSVGNEGFSMSQSNTMRGKNVADLVGMNKLYIDDSRSYSKKSDTNSQLQDSGSLSVNLSRSIQYQIHERDQACMGQMSYQSNAPQNQVKKASTTLQLNNVQQIPVQTRGQVALQAFDQQSGHHPGSENQTSSPPKAPLMINSLEPGEKDFPLESSKSRRALVGKGKGSIQGHGSVSFPYGGGQVMRASGNIGSASDDQNNPATPTFFPVMQFGGQHPGGMGDPAVGMAFPGYVGNPGSGKSEMTWLPDLAGAAGAMGANYCTPYLSVDGAYHARPSGQIPPISAASSRENNMHKPGNELKPSQRPELANDEFGQRQNKARRYTQMKFDE